MFFERFVCGRKYAKTLWITAKLMDTSQKFIPLSCLVLGSDKKIPIPWDWLEDTKRDLKNMKNVFCVYKFLFLKFLIIKKIHRNIHVHRIMFSPCTFPYMFISDWWQKLQSYNTSFVHSSLQV